MNTSPIRATMFMEAEQHECRANKKFLMLRKSIFVSLLMMFLFAAAVQALDCHPGTSDYRCKTFCGNRGFAFGMCSDRWNCYCGDR
ncbi:hypothetical protein DICVIV_07076 [Dictyocaulus viviparus]|uniref:Uncharacterized protein n=1 Tax=Dictyocaulus viviparus TaxID=29172 RepID=A0A0D8XSW2_DICVI|nr:hypothetical protein DICVIV_07076 [Dictyocaulus viviparus]